jgi:hypothetical protein
MRSLLTSPSIVHINIARKHRSMLAVEARANITNYNTFQDIMQSTTRETFQQWAEKTWVSSPGLVPTDPIW